MTFIIQRRLSLTAALLLIGFVLSACGGAAATGGSVTPTQSPHMTTVTVCEAGTSVAFFTEYVAQQEGYFKAQGLNVPTPIQVSTGAKAAAGIESGNCTIANGVITDVFGLVKIDKSVRIIGDLLNAYAVDIVVSKQFLQQSHLTDSSPLSAKIMALKGKKIGITGPHTGTQALLTYLFKLEGMNASTDATQVSLGANSIAALTALQTGRVDALSFFAPFGQVAVAKGVGDILISPIRGDVPQLVGDVQGIFYTKQSVINTQPQVVAGYIRAIARAETFIHANPTQTEALLTKYLGLASNITSAIYQANAPVIATSPQISQAAYTIAGQFHLSAGLITQVPPFSQIVATSTITNALAQS